jgi:two-component system phosphate regulon sensor histidine kinase PhoR
LRLQKRIIISHLSLTFIVFVFLWFYFPEVPVEQFFLAFFVALCISALIGLLVVRPILRRIGETGDFLRDVIEKGPSKTLFTERHDEIGELGRMLNTVLEDIRTKMDGLVTEKGILETIFNTIRDGIVVIDKTGIITLANPSVKRILGIEEDIRGRDYFEILRDPAIQDAVKEAHDTGRTSLREVELFHPQNKNLYITVTPISGLPDRGRFVIVIHDITKLRHLETVRKDFVANVSHELKTPITAIKGFAETLLDGALEERDSLRSYLEIIKNHSERLNNLVEDLLTLSKLDRGEIHLKPDDVNLRETVDLVFLTLKDKAIAKGIGLNNDIPHDFPLIRADRDRLIQILLNLIDNSIKFTERGEVRVKGRIVEAQAGSVCEFSVEDTGIGISARDIPRLGERFYRVDKARSRELGGTGLGLAIVKHLVRIHGWQMRIESDLGKGTRVFIDIPSSSFLQMT